MSRRRLWSTMTLLMIFHQIISYQYYSTTPVRILQLLKKKTFQLSSLLTKICSKRTRASMLNPHLESCRIILNHLEPLQTCHTSTKKPLGPLETPSTWLLHFPALEVARRTGCNLFRYSSETNLQRWWLRYLEVSWGWNILISLGISKFFCNNYG